MRERAPRRARSWGAEQPTERRGGRAAGRGGRRAGARSGGKVLFPLYWNLYDRAAQQEATVLFPLYWSFNDPKRDLTLVLPWFHSERKDVHRVTHGLVPLYYYSEDKYGYTFQLLGGLYGVDHVNKTQESEYQILWIPF